MPPGLFRVTFNYMQDFEYSGAENGRIALPLTLATVKELWSKTYNTAGKPDWSHIFPYYHPDIVFQDSIQRLEGIEAFKALCQRLTERCEELRMDIHSAAQEGNVIHMQWTMTMMFKKFPSTPVYGATVLTLMPREPSSLPTDFVRAMSPPLDAE